MYVCLCRGITESDVERVGAQGLVDPETLSAALGLEDDDCCGRCAKNVQDLASIAARGCSRDPCPCV